MFRGSRMKNFVIIVLIVMIASFAIAGILFVGEYGKDNFSIFRGDIHLGNAVNVDEERSEAITGIQYIEVGATSDDITFIPADSNEVKARFYGQYSTSDSEYKPEFIFTKAGDRLTIKIDYKPHIGVLSYTSNLKLDVYLPRSFSGNLKVGVTSAGVKADELNLEDFYCSTTSGSFSARMVNAKKAELHSTSGENRINGVFESFRFNSTSGRFISENLISKETVLGSTSGSITVKGNPGKIDVTSTSGSLDLQFNEYDTDITTHTTSGGTKIKLPENAQFQLKFKTASGSARCDFPLTITGTQIRNNVEGTVGSDRNKITVTSTSGSLEIIK